MFEKEAEELFKKKPLGYEMKPEIEIYKDGFKDGYNKANEWHYVKDELPKDNEYVLIYTELKNTYVAKIPTEKNYFITRHGGFVQMSAVIAWKEIVLPKENE